VADSRSQSPEDLLGSAKLNISDDELIYFSMGPWDMEQDDPWSNLRQEPRWTGDLSQSRLGRCHSNDKR
jgi:hypothetical protein